MSVSDALASFVGSLTKRDATVEVLVAAAQALAAEVDQASIPDDNGKVRSAAAAVRELRATVAELIVKGGVVDGNVGEGDWTNPANVIPIAGAGAAKVRNAKKRG